MTRVTEKTLDAADGVETAEQAAALARGNDPNPPVVEQKMSALDRLEAIKADMEAKGIELLCPIPGTNNEMVGRFTKLTKDEKARFASASEKAPHGLSKEQKNIRTMCLRIAMQCRELRVGDEVIEGDTRQSGFTYELGQRIGTQPIEGGSREPDMADTVWRVIGCDDEALIGLTRVLVKWSTNPSHLDLSDVPDPFVSI